MTHKCPKCNQYFVKVLTTSHNGRVVFGACVKCGAVEIRLDEQGQVERPVTIPEDIVKKSRAKWMSALIKAIRMGLEEEAAYWMSVLLISDGISHWYLARRLLMSVYEDVPNVQATREASALFTGGIRGKGAEREIFHVMLLLCRAPKFYADPVARQCTLDWLDTEEHKEKYNLYGKDKKSDDDLFISLKKAIQAKNFKHSWLIYNEILNVRKIMLYEELSDNILAMAENVPEHVKEYGKLICDLSEESVRYGDQNSIFMLAQAITVGINNEENVISDEDVEIATKYVDFVKDQWRANRLRKVPGWALDGMHAGAGDQLPDKRFAGTTWGIKNMLAMFEKYGRLHPDDEGVFYKVKKFENWEAQIQKIGDGRFNVQSQSGNGSYVVDLGANTCTCPAFQHRKGSCKHIKLLKLKKVE